MPEETIRDYFVQFGEVSGREVWRRGERGVREGGGGVMGSEGGWRRGEWKGREGGGGEGSRESLMFL